MLVITYKCPKTFRHYNKTILHVGICYNSPRQYFFDELMNGKNNKGKGYKNL